MVRVLTCMSQPPLGTELHQGSSRNGTVWLAVAFWGQRTTSTARMVRRDLLCVLTSAGALASENKHLLDQRYSLYHTQNSHPCRRPCSSSVDYFVILKLRANLARSLNSRRSKLHGSRPCSPTNTLVAHTNQVAPQGSASSTSCPSRARTLPQQPCRTRSYALARACVSSLVASDSNIQ